jgi:hypothetical protein
LFLRRSGGGHRLPRACRYRHLSLEQVHTLSLEADEFPPSPSEIGTGIDERRELRIDLTGKSLDLEGCQKALLYPPDPRQLDSPTGRLTDEANAASGGGRGIEPAHPGKPAHRF